MTTGWRVYFRVNLSAVSDCEEVWVPSLLVRSSFPPFLPPRPANNTNVQKHRGMELESDEAGSEMLRLRLRHSFRRVRESQCSSSIRPPPPPSSAVRSFIHSGRFSLWPQVDDGFPSIRLPTLVRYERRREREREGGTLTSTSCPANKRRPLEPD